MQFSAIVSAFKAISVLLSVVMIHTIIFAAPKSDTTYWRVVPIRSQAEYELGHYGGEGEQHLHSIARSLNNPNYIYLSHDVGGAWRSRDGGERWEKSLDIGLYVNNGQSIEVDPNDPDVVFLIVDSSWNWIAKGMSGLYRSVDGGDHWEHVLYSPVKKHRIYRHTIAYDITSCEQQGRAKRWYVAFPGYGLYRSEEGGEQWGTTPVSSLADVTIVYEIKTHPSDGKTVYVATDKGLYRSDSLGYHLYRIESIPETDISSINIHPNKTDSLFVTLYKKGLYCSGDGGAHFELIRSGEYLRLHMNPGFPQQLYLIGANKNTVMSNDGGRNWYSTENVETFPGLNRENGWRRWIDGNMSGIVPNPLDPNEAVAYSRSTLFKTTDGGIIFKESATGFTGNGWSWWTNSAAFDKFNPDRFAFFCCDVGTRITTTGGKWFLPKTNAQTWNWYSQGLVDWLGTYSGDFQPIEGSDVMVASVGNYWRTQLMRTVNEGADWELITKTPETEEHNLFVRFHPLDPNIVYAGNKISYDAGKSFQFVTFTSSYESPSIMGMCESYPDVIYALDKSRRYILRSNDRGETWKEYAHPGWRFNVVDKLPTFAADPVDPNKVYTLDEDHDLAVFDGKTWKSLHVLDSVQEPDFNFVRSVAVDPKDPQILYAGMFASGIPCVFRTTDGGTTWHDVTYNLPRTGCGAMKVNFHTGELYKGSSVGTWILPPPLQRVSIKSGQSIRNIHKRMNVMMNRNVLHISYKIVSPGMVKLGLYDLAGREIVKIAHERKQPGSHHEYYICSTKAKGIYFCRINTKEYRGAIKVIYK